jgi:hypothetical protein
MVRNVVMEVPQLFVDAGVNIGNAGVDTAPFLEPSDGLVLFGYPSFLIISCFPADRKQTCCNQTFLQAVRT